MNEILKNCTIFERRLRLGTTGSYCKSALEEVVDIAHFSPDQLYGNDFSSFDFVMHIDDGLQYPLPEINCLSGYWAIDTHLDFKWSLHRSRNFDLVFAAQRDGAERLRQAGIHNAVWLPLGCDAEIHGKKEIPKQYDVGFVGHSFPGDRENYLKLISERYPNSFLGTADYREMSSIYSASKIVFNRSIRNDINMRVFEALASGSLLITNDLSDNGQSELFESGKHFITYSNEKELIEAIDYYLAHDEEREAIAEAGYKEVIAHHTYKDRMERVLRAAEDYVPPAPIVITNSERTPKSMDHAKRPSKSVSYFEFPRPEVQALVPRSARNVLDIGCGTGRLGEGLKQRQACHVTGIELVESSAELAKCRLDDVLMQNVEEESFDFPEDHFDCIVCADILEHLREPGVVLTKMRRWLKPEGSLVLSIPNVRHHSVITSLLEGNWTYESAGLLDNDHVRFFTRREIEKLLFRNGFQVEQMESVPGPGDEDRRKQSDSRSLNLSGLQIAAKSDAEADEFFAYQYLLRATPVKKQTIPLTSIIIVTHNQIGYTHECVESILLRTDEPYELIFVDNGSSDGTPDYLQSIDGATVILNQKNLGFPAAVNQGIEVANGENILLLNNDTIVTTGWLRHMLDAMQSEDSIGLVGPCTNNISGPQQVGVSYRQLNELDGFAWDRGQILSGKVSDEERLVGFCLMIHKDVIKTIGSLDEQFGIGNFEDDDFCRRAREAGYRTVMAEASFVHHFGSVTFKGSGVNFHELMQENQRKYKEKWNDSDEANLIQDSEGNSTVSLCMIVRDNEEIISDALSSIKPWVDEMIVVDTGSKDRTAEISEELGAKVFHFPWCDDFSAARNESLKHATGDWVFWMDSDDTIDEEQGQKLRDLVNRSHKQNILGYVMQVHCPSYSGGSMHQDVTVVDHIKLFRNRSELRFEHRIHEQIIPAIRRAGGDVEWTDIFVTHSGTDQTYEEHQGKLKRDFALLHLDLEDRPDHPFVLFNLGMTYADAGQYDESIGYLERCLEVSKPVESHVRKAYALLVSSLQQLKKYPEADKVCHQGLEYFAEDAELLFRSAMLHHQAGRLSEAEQDYRSIFKINHTDKHFSSTDKGILGHKAYHNLAVVLVDQKRLKDAADIWQQIIVEEPNFVPAWRGLVDVYEQMGDESLLSQLKDNLSKHPSLSVSDIFLDTSATTANSTA